MKPHLYIISVIAVLFASCYKEYNEPQYEEFVDVECVCDTEPSSKALNTAYESTISNCYIFVYQSDGLLYLGQELTDADRKSLSLRLRVGCDYTIYVISNCGSIDLSDYKRISDILDKTALLSEEGVLNARGPTMCGQKSISVGTTNETVHIDLKRLLGRVRLRSVTNLLPVNLGSLNLKRAYLCNVPMLQNYANTLSCDLDLWANRYGCKKAFTNTLPIESAADSDVPALLYADLGSITLARSSSCAIDQNFYAYQNLSSAVPLRAVSGTFEPCTIVLMVVAEIMGTEYYYPIALREGLTANSNTDISLIISAKGNTAADHFNIIDKVACSASIYTSYWTVMSPYTDSI